MHPKFGKTMPGCELEEKVKDDFVVRRWKKVLEYGYGALPCSLSTGSSYHVSRSTHLQKIFEVSRGQALHG
jgi:hypothetical protein